MLTQDEAELYDRQIRLWGVNAQSKIRQSKVLMLGFNGLASEVAKILVLAGIDTLTIVDDQPLQESDLTCNLFCRRSEEKSQFRTHAVKSKLKILNPLVNVNIENVPILSKKGEDFKQYDLVTLHSFLTIEETSAINDLCRASRAKFYVVLDYGFFGFMFNDLGPEFKFSYEEYNSATEVTRASGQEKDPIAVEDDASDANDNGYRNSDDDDDDQGDRPKKRQRVHSPARGVAETKAEVDEKQTKIGSLPYVPFQAMISLKNFVFSKKTSPILLISIAMYRFYSQYKHLPRYENSQVRQDDISKLNEIIISMKDSLNLNDIIFKNLDKEWSENIYGSISPVCAVMGGVAGQDMIRALSSKDIPINNTFAFDGISMNGIVEKMGLVNPKAASNQPCILDFVQIDDDD